ncbi:DnaA regulatory inactivator Hda [Marinospirillum perlucidum]|uniref:DnaA regulatory inactivator Hda n=1 Tax=Marinospirillum perlucidum TaxID=1982602 RepID=UPI000DF289AD|nr:DnaA regulatory inactivator Hda [Marinospirillum perlucidum]
MVTPVQLSLGVNLQDTAHFSNFHLGKNPAIASHLPKMLDEPGFRYVFLWGKQDSGKSHLLQASYHLAKSQGREAAYLALQDLAGGHPDQLSELDQDLVCLDDLDAVAGIDLWEEALFHMYNRLRDQGKMLLITATSAPAHLPVNLPDLASRLAWGLTYQLQTLEDDDKLAALQLRASKRGLQMPDEVARYILHRSPRRLSGLFATLDVLDEASLKEQRKLTIPFVRQALKW